MRLSVNGSSRSTFIKVTRQITAATIGIMDTMLILLIAVIICNFSNATPIATDDGSLQNLHSTLLTIEEKLTNLESFVMIQCGTRINGKLDYYGRKIDNIEKTLSKLEVYAKVELEKITENINSKNFKEDISKERIIRNIDAVYEKINHKLTGMQGQADVANLKMKNNVETTIAKLEKIEESLTIRDADMEAELSDATTAIDDLKTVYTNMEESSINLIKKSTKSILKESDELKNYYKQLEFNTKNISDSVAYIQEAFDSFLTQTVNNTETIILVKDEVLENLNEYGNKFTDVHSNLWQKTDLLDSKLQQIANVTNLSRNELQNNLRALMVQFGRLSGKDNVQNDYNNKLDELNKKVDTNFQDILLTQNLFLESCHRVQMDETQIESQISVVLNKVIDIFENKTSINANDIKQLQNMIRVHDSNMKRSVQNVLTNLKELLEKVLKENNQIISNFSDQKQNLEIVHILLKDILNSKNPTLLETILRTIQNLQKIIEEPHNDTHNSTMQLLNEIRQEVVQQNSNNINISNIIQSINFALNNIETKINNYLVNKNSAEEITNMLSQHLQKSFKPTPTINHQQNISDLLTEIFGKPPNTQDIFIVFDGQLTFFNTSRNKIENTIMQCNSKQIICKKIYNSTYSIYRENEKDYMVLNCLPHYIDLVDVRFASNDEVLNCTLTKSSQRKCLPNYHDLIDMRFNRDDFIKCTEEEIRPVLPSDLPNYVDIIDVRFSSDSNNTNGSESTTATTSTVNQVIDFVNFIETSADLNTKDTQNEVFRVNLMTTQRSKNADTQQESFIWNPFPEQDLSTAKLEEFTLETSINHE